jgi:hypothetical protein
MISEGVDVKFVSKVLAHANASITINVTRIYSRAVRRVQCRPPMRGYGEGAPDRETGRMFQFVFQSIAGHD